MPKNHTQNLDDLFAQQLGVALMSLSKLVQAVERGDARLTRDAIEESRMLLELHQPEAPSTTLRFAA